MKAKQLISRFGRDRMARLALAAADARYEAWEEWIEAHTRGRYPNAWHPAAARLQSRLEHAQALYSELGKAEAD